MQNYYFTFGSEGQPFYGGWVVISANSRAEASEIFRTQWPDKEQGILNCAFVYPESEFMETDMPEKGNLGRYCHAMISKINFAPEGEQNYG